MLKVIAFGLSAGVGVQALAGWDTGGKGTRWSLAVAFAVAVVCAYLGGKSRRGGAVAVAVASAEANAAAVAQNRVNVVVMPAVSAGGSPGIGVPTEAAPWMVGAVERPSLTLDDLDGLDVSELVTSESLGAAGLAGLLGAVR